MRKGPSRWRRMDNIAQLFTPAADNKDPLVFRLSCTLKEPVEPEPLQRAVERALDVAPYFRSVIRKGVFWYYLEESDLNPIVHEENRPPCTIIYRRGAPGLLFDVSYFDCRIHLECFHSLCDGAGGIQFLKAIVLLYFHEKYGGAQPTLDFLPSGDESGRDNIQKHFVKTPVQPAEGRRAAFRLKGEEFPECRLGVLEGRMSVAPLLALAKQAGCSLTEYVSAAIIYSIGRTMTKREKRRPVALTVPADMRRFFPLDKSSRNFFSIMNVRYQFQGEDSFEQILASVHQEFEHKLKPDELLARMNLMASLEHHVAVRAVPLFLKMPVLRIANFQSKRMTTASLSNLGVIQFEPEAQARIADFSAISSTRQLHICMGSCGDVFSITLASHVRDVSVQRNLFQFLAARGIPVTISQSIGEEEEV